MKERAERAIFDLRRGQPLRLVEGAKALLVASVEALHRYDAAALSALADAPARIVLSGSRAMALGLATDAGSPVSVALGVDEFDLVRALAGLIDHEVDLPRAPPVPASALEAGAVALALAGRLLPAMLVFDLGERVCAALGPRLADESVLDLPLAAVATVASADCVELRRISEAEVPLAQAEQSRFVHTVIKQMIVNACRCFRRGKISRRRISR